MNLLLMLLSITSLTIPVSTSPPKTQSTLFKGSSLSSQNSNDILVSPNGAFTAGFLEVGQNAVIFSVWFTHSAAKTVAWTANRDYPINGKQSKLQLTKDGSLILIDAGLSVIWSSGTAISSDAQLHLLDSGNLVLCNSSSSFDFFWQSFDFPTHTLLPGQLLTKEAPLISSVSPTNHSSGYYKLYFDTDNILRLLYDGPEVSSPYWPDPLAVPWEVNRYSNNDSKVATYDSLGHFESSDLFEFYASDYGNSSFLRRLTLDVDGNLRMYSLKENGVWEVTWQAFIDQCTVHGLCGPNSFCTYEPSFGRKCSCLPGFVRKDGSDWSQGCEPMFSVNAKDDIFIGFPHMGFYGYVEFYQNDYRMCQNSTFDKCTEICLKIKTCVAFLLKWNPDDNSYDCMPKSRLLNGYLSPDYQATLYLRVPQNLNISPTFSKDEEKLSELQCSENATAYILHRDYPSNRTQRDNILKLLVWFFSIVGIVEIIIMALTLCFFSREREKWSETAEGYVLAAGFRKFTYTELKRATSNFRKEHVIGRGGSGVVYKGKMGNGKVGAIKKLNDPIQGEDEFLAEMNTIGRLNHMNLIDIWGYCAEGKHRLLVFEFMENRSLAQRLHSRRFCLDWGKRYRIAQGAARGLAYLHEECLEWVLHCDVKPQNILLDGNYNPKVADFGLSKLVNRNGGGTHSGFSQIRGTRGYMAPEWVTNEPITSKVDVYSYGVVMFELVTGKNGGKIDLVMWARKTRKTAMEVESWIAAIADPRLEGEYEEAEMRALALLALQCVQDNKEARPTMSQVVELLDRPNGF